MTCSRGRRRPSRSASSFTNDAALRRLQAAAATGPPSTTTEKLPSRLMSTRIPPPHVPASTCRTTLRPPVGGFEPFPGSAQVSARRQAPRPEDSPERRAGGTAPAGYLHRVSESRRARAVPRSLLRGRDRLAGVFQHRYPTVAVTGMTGVGKTELVDHLCGRTGPSQAPESGSAVMERRVR